jgi:hypothetical protein
MEMLIAGPLVLFLLMTMVYLYATLLKTMVEIVWKLFFEVPLRDPDRLSARQKALWRLTLLPWRDQQFYWDSLELATRRALVSEQLDLPKLHPSVRQLLLEESRVPDFAVLPQAPRVEPGLTAS